MERLTSQHERRSLAYELIRRKLRTPIVHLHTHIPEAEIREVFRELHGCSARSGLLPSISTFLVNRKRHVYVSLFAVLYNKLGGSGVFQNIDIPALLEAWDRFMELTDRAPKTRPATLTEAWVVARDLRAGLAVLQACPRCGSQYLVVEYSKVPPTCPICALCAQNKRAGGSRRREAEHHSASGGNSGKRLQADGNPRSSAQPASLAAQDRQSRSMV